MNHPKITSLTRAVASDLHLDPTFINFVFAEERPECFRYRCENADGGWTCFVPEDVNVAYPLWSANADQTLLLILPDGMTYGQGYHDEPSINMISRTSQGLLATLLNAIYESEVSDEELEAAARFCGFRYLNDYLSFVNAPIPDGMDWYDRFEQFISGIDERSVKP